MVAGQIDSVWFDELNGTFHMIDWKRCLADLSPQEGEQFGGRGRRPREFMLDNRFNHYAMQQNLYAVMLRDRYQVELSSMVGAVASRPANL